MSPNRICKFLIIGKPVNLKRLIAFSWVLQTDDLKIKTEKMYWQIIERYKPFKDTSHWNLFKEEKQSEKNSVQTCTIKPTEIGAKELSKEMCTLVTAYGVTCYHI